MNQNRCCPGVPNRYRIRLSSSVTRPKSIATVVVVLSGVCDRSSTPLDAAVITGETVSELAKSTQYPFQQPDVRAALSVVGLVDPHQALHCHVGDQDPRHA